MFVLYMPNYSIWQLLANKQAYSVDVLSKYLCSRQFVIVVAISLESPHSLTTIGPDLSQTGDEMHSQYLLFRESVGAFTLNSFFWSAVEKDQWSRSLIPTWNHYVEDFLSHILHDISLHTGMTKDKVQNRLKSLVRDWSDQSGVVQQIEAFRSKKPHELRKLLQQNRALNSDAFSKFGELFRKEEYPPGLWLELDRA